MQSSADAYGYAREEVYRDWCVGCDVSCLPSVASQSHLPLHCTWSLRCTCLLLGNLGRPVFAGQPAGTAGALQPRPTGRCIRCVSVRCSPLHSPLASHEASCPLPIAKSLLPLTPRRSPSPPDPFPCACLCVSSRASIVLDSSSSALPLRCFCLLLLASCFSLSTTPCSNHPPAPLTPHLAPRLVAPNSCSTSTSSWQLNIASHPPPLTVHAHLRRCLSPCTIVLLSGPCRRLLRHVWQLCYRYVFKPLSLSRAPHPHWGLSPPPQASRAAGLTLTSCQLRLCCTARPRASIKTHSLLPLRARPADMADQAT